MRIGFGALVVSFRPGCVDFHRTTQDALGLISVSARDFFVSRMETGITR
jgi:hypothetical protein